MLSTLTFLLMLSASAAIPIPFTQDADVGYNLLMETAIEEFTSRCVESAHPSWAVGDFIIPSVGKFEMGDRKFVGTLDAFGKMQKYELTPDGKVCATYKMMDTGFYNDSVKTNTIDHGMLFYETEPARKCPLLHPMCNMQAPNDNTFVNTFMVGDKLLTTTDGPTFLEIDRETLHVTGVHTFNDTGIQGKIPYSGSAHPVQHPLTGDWIDFVANGNLLKDQMEVSFFSIGDNAANVRKSLANVTADAPPYMHSFGVTDRNLVLPRMPVKFDIKAVLGKPMHDAFLEIENPTEGENGFNVVPLDGSSTTGRNYPFPAGERLYFTHQLNAYENATGTVIDICILASNPFSGNLTVAAFQDKATRDAAPRDTVKRFHLPYAAGAAMTSEVLSDPATKTDFVKINQAYAAKKHCFFWGNEWFTDGASYASMAIAKYDVCNGNKKTSFHRAGWYPSEPTFVANPSPASEDDGVLLFTLLDGAHGETSVMVVDARTMAVVEEAGPFPRVGFTTHGEWYAAPGNAQAPVPLR